MSEIFTPLDYVMQHGGRCRGCADHDGICPGDFMPCDTGTKRSAVAWVIGALEYGRKHGYIVDPPAPPPIESFAAHGEYERAVGGEIPEGWKLVPVDAQSEMMNAAIDAARKELPNSRGLVGWVQMRAAWSAMLAASPTPPDAYSARLASSSEPEPGPEGFDEQVPVIPEPPFPIGAATNAKRVGWTRYFTGHRREDNPFPGNRLDLERGYNEGWDAAAERAPGQNR